MLFAQQATRLAAVTGLFACAMFSHAAGPVKGTLLGRPFQPDKVTLTWLGPASVTLNDGKREEAETYHLKFRNGREFFADQEIVVVLQLPRGTKPSQIRWAQRALKFGTEEYRNQHYPNGNSVGHGAIGTFLSELDRSRRRPETVNQSDGIQVRLAIASSNRGALSGQIELVIPSRNTRLAGSFRAELQDLRRK